MEQLADHNSSETDEAVWNRKSCNFLVISESGKPIFARYGSETEIARICGLLQALRGSILYNDTIGESLGDIQSIETESMILVFMQVGSITLVAIDNIDTATESFLRQQLEQLYSQLVFSATEHVQQAFQHNANFDLQSVIGTNGESLIKSLLDHSDIALGEPAVLTLCGNLSLCPLSPSTRDKVSCALEAIGNETENTLFAFVFAKKRLVSLVQPEYGPHLMRSADLNLLMHYVEQQPGISTGGELWLPVCLPRFNSSGFLYCYANCLDVNTGLMLSFVSNIGTSEQCQLFHKASLCVRRQLNLVLDSSKNEKTLEEENSEEDWVDASGNGDNMIAYVQPHSVVTEEVRAAFDSVQSGKFFNEFLDVAGALHFVFRFDAQVLTKRKRGSKKKSAETIGYLTQCIVSPMRFPLEPVARQRLWRMYQKLSLRIRLGSALSESVQDALSMLQRNILEYQTGVGHHCPSSGLLESKPQFTGLVFCYENGLSYFGMNGPAFELYFCCSGRLTVKEAALAGARLARRVHLEQSRLFLTKPPTWRED